MDIDAIFERANAAAGDGDFAEARRIALEALAASPDDPALHNLMGALEATADHTDLAREWFAKALALDPANIDYRMNVAVQSIIGGHFDVAREELGRVLNIDPEHAVAYAHLAFITRVEPGDPMIDKLEKLSANRSAPAHFLIHYHYALGKCYEDVGDHDRAFANYRASKEPLAGRYNHDAYVSTFTGIKEICSREFISARGENGYRSRKPVFIVGLPRCGSTLLAQKLAERPGVADLGERTDLRKIDRAISKNHPASAFYPGSLPHLREEAFAEFGEWYVETLSAERPEAVRLIDQNNMQFQYVGLIASMLPDALVIEARRNAIANCLSIYFSDIVSTQDWAFSLDTLGRYYRLYADLMRHWENAVPNFVRARYERTVSDTPAVVSELSARMGLDAEAGLKPQDNSRIRTLSAVQARQPVHLKSVEKWRNYEKHLGPLIDALGDLAV